MKLYFHLLPGVLFLAMTACTNLDDTDPAPRKTPPIAEFVSATGYISASTTVAVNQPFKLKYQIKKGSSGLTQWYYSKQYLTILGTNFDLSIGESSPSGNIQSPIIDENSYSLSTTGTYKFKVLSKDLNNEYDSSVIRVTVQ